MTNLPTPLPDIPPNHDPLDILNSTKPVVERAALVQIDHDAVASVAADVLDEPLPAPEWDATLHYRDGTWQTAGWVLTEMGRQPWIVQGLLKTEDAVSPTVSAWTVGVSLGVFAGLYGILAVVDFVLMRRYARVDPPDPSATEPEAEPVPALGY